MEPNRPGNRSETVPAMFDVEPTSRPYRHDRCGGVTVVSGWSFREVCNPFNSGVPTKCAACGRTAPMSEFRSDDTGEPLPTYHQRLRPYLPPGYAAAQHRAGFAFAIGLVIGGLVGAGVGAALDFIEDAPQWGGLGGAIIGGVIGAWLVMSKVPKVGFRRFV